MNERLALSLTLAVAVLILFTTLSSPSLKSHTGLPIDKFAHFGAFFLLIAPSALLAPRYVWKVAVFGLLLGLGVEIIQPYVGRGREMMDFIADALGLAIGGFAGLRLHPFVRKAVAQA